MPNAFKLLAGIAVFIVVMSWTLLGYDLSVEKFIGPEQIRERCDGQKTAYCLGFAEGFNFAADQCAFQKKIDRIDWEQLNSGQ